MGGEKLLPLLLAVNPSEKLLYLDFPLELHESVEESLGTRRTSGYIDIDRDDLIDTCHYSIRIFKAVERA